METVIIGFVIFFVVFTHIACLVSCVVFLVPKLQLWFDARTRTYELKSVIVAYRLRLDNLRKRAGKLPSKESIPSQECLGLAFDFTQCATLQLNACASLLELFYGARFVTEKDVNKTLGMIDGMLDQAEGYILRRDTIPSIAKHHRENVIRMIHLLEDMCTESLAFLDRFELFGHTFLKEREELIAAQRHVKELLWRANKDIDGISEELSDMLKKIGGIRAMLGVRRAVQQTMVSLPVKGVKDVQ